MGDQPNCVARRTRYQIQKFYDEYFKKKAAEKARMGANGGAVCVGRDSDIEILTPVNGGTGRKKKRLRKAAKMGENGSDGGEGSVGDIESDIQKSGEKFGGQGIDEDVEILSQTSYERFDNDIEKLSEKFVPQASRFRSRNNNKRNRMNVQKVQPPRGISSPYQREDHETKNGEYAISRKAGNVLENVGGTAIGMRKRVLGLDIWVTNNQTEKEVSRSRLERLRPRPLSNSSRKQLRGGKYIDDPLDLSESENSDASTDEGSDIDDLVTNNDTESDRDDVGKLSRGQSRALKNADLKKILVNSILQKDNELEEDFSHPEEVTPAQNLLPLKFRFGEEDPAPQEKDEWQKEVDKLFADLETGLTESEIGSAKSFVPDNDDITAVATNPLERCRLGNHNLILDESTGIICKCCGAVFEMKYVLPNLRKETFGRRDWMSIHTDDRFTFDGHQFDSSACEYNSISRHAKGSVLDLIPAYILKSLYPHQLDGFEFLWKKLAGETSIEKLKTPLPNKGTGSIISHAPGTGKTCLTIVFLLTFMKVYPACRPVLIAPCTMLHTWAEEFRKWKVNIPFFNLNDIELSDQEITLATCLLGKTNGKRDREYVRLVKLFSWKKNRSILGISYSLFEQLVGEPVKKGHEEVRKILLELPGLLVLDEGHIPRNDQSCTWKALTKVQTRRRIILSGTPFQNNFDELYNTLCLVNPRFDEHISSERRKDSGRRRSNAAKGKWDFLISSIDRNADNSLEDLKALIDPFVHLHKGTILQESLPGLKDTLVLLRPTDEQKDLIQRIPDTLGSLDKEYVMSWICVHPALPPLQKAFPQSVLQKFESNPCAGVKTEFVIEITRLSNALGEKVLVFSQYIETLNFLMKQLTRYFSWTEGREVLYMDGRLQQKQRQTMIDRLNNPKSEVKVLLASTRAFSEGINLVGASRVVLLDIVWNPSVKRQAISRAYRLGQKKIVYVYHLITSGTMEVEKYAKQFKKDVLSQLVFSSSDGQTKKSEIPSLVKDDRILEIMVQHPKVKNMFEEIVGQPRESNLFENFNFVELQH